MSASMGRSASAARATLLAALACLLAAPGPASGAGLESQLRDVLAGLDATVKDEAGVVTTQVRCASAPFAEAYCLQSSMLMYQQVMQAIRARKLDVSGRILTFSTHMRRMTPPGKSEDFVLLAASWDGSDLMRADAAKLSSYDMVDLVKDVQADRNWWVAESLRDVCRGMYGNPPRLCTMAMQAARW